MEINVKVSKWTTEKLITAFSSMVILAGVAREIFLYLYGYETMVQDLRILALDSEHCIPAWYSSLLLLLCSVLLALSAIGTARLHMPYVKYWAVLALLFFGFSIDEAASIHELAIIPLRNAFDLSGVFYYSWVIPGVMLVAVIGLSYVRFLLNLRKRTAYFFVLAAVLYVGGALGLEFSGGYFFDKYGPEYIAYIVSATAEEALEIIGLTIFFVGLMEHVAFQSNRWIIDVTP